jgi:Family of unknown function (DUF5681)
MATDDEEDANSRAGGDNPGRDTRFKPGESGNPKGRPKGSCNLSTKVSQRLRETITVMKGGKPVKMTKGDVIATQLVDDSMKNNLKATAMVFKLQEQGFRHH